MAPKNPIESARNSSLYKLTTLVTDLVSTSGLTQKEISKMMNTSTPQISRVLNRGNINKTLDQLVRVAACTGHEISFSASPVNMDKDRSVSIEKKFTFVNHDEVNIETESTLFRGLSIGLKSNE